MLVSKSSGLVMTMAIITCLAGCVIPTSEHPSVWTSLGVPQAWNAAGGHFINRRGGRPNRELKPPVKRIADPENLESKVPAIKKAAEIKQAEDMKAQKIKAVRYLAETAGCGCYDEEGEVTDALVAALDDCTEDVRFATVKALLARAEKQKKDGPCHRCSGGCCNQKLIDKLSSLVYDLDDKGCRVEPSERVRSTAKAVLQICCPTRCQNYAQPMPAPEPAVKEVEEEKNLEGVPDDTDATMPESGSGEGSEDPAMNEEKDLSVENTVEFPVLSAIDSEDSGLATLNYSNDDHVSSVTAVSQTTVVSSTIPSRKTEIVTGGSVLEIAAGENCALVTFNESILVPVGTRLALKRKHKLGRIDYLGEVEVLESEDGRSVVRPVPPLTISRMGTGDSVLVGR